MKIGYIVIVLQSLALKHLKQGGILPVDYIKK